MTFICFEYIVNKKKKKKKKKRENIMSEVNFWDLESLRSIRLNILKNSKKKED